MKTDLFNYQSKNEPNTNFRFPTDEGTRYLTTSTGQKLPYKLFSGRNDANPNSGILREAQNKEYATDFALIERQFCENKSLSFCAGTKISGVNDVAWLFRALEDEAVEHTFVLYKFKNNSYLVQHLSTGGITSTVVDLRLLAGNVFKMHPESITLVHNHPSGQLVSSKHDRAMLQRLHDIFDTTGIKVEDGIIINLRSGQYLVFSDNAGNDRVMELSAQEQSQRKVSAFSFNKQIFSANYQPAKITSPEDTAAYISCQKFGLSDKTEAIILNNANNIVGKFILPQIRQLEELTIFMTVHGGAAVILYGNNINEQMYKEYSEKLELMGFTVLDGILLKSGNYHSLYQKSDIDIDDDLVKKFATVNGISEPTTKQVSQNILVHLSKSGNPELFKSKRNEKLVKGTNVNALPADGAPELKTGFSSEPTPFAAPYIFNRGDAQSAGLYENSVGESADRYKRTSDKTEIQKNSYHKVNSNNQIQNIMQTLEFNQTDYLKNQLKYLGFGDGEKLHKDLEKGIKGKNLQFEIKTVSDKALPGNKADFVLKFNKTESGSVFFNAYQAKLKKADGEELSHVFPVNRENTFTAKEAVNLLEGRSVKIEFHNPKSDQSETAFVQFNFEEPKTEKGNYMFQNFYKNYGVDTENIVSKANLVFDQPEYRENTVKSLEKGNVVKVKFEIDDKVMEGKAVLNPQYKNLNLYDHEMNRINTNKPMLGPDNDEKHDKANVREQSIRR